MVDEKLLEKISWLYPDAEMGENEDGSSYIKGNKSHIIFNDKTFALDWNQKYTVLFASPANELLLSTIKEILGEPDIKCQIKFLHEKGDIYYWCEDSVATEAMFELLNKESLRLDVISRIMGIGFRKAELLKKN